MKRIACIGEAMVELSADPATPERARLGFAGDTLNTAIYLKRSAPSLTVDYVTRLGRDAFSDQLCAFIEAEDVATGLIGRSDTRNVGLYAISTDAEGERSFTYWRDRSAARELFREPGPDLADLDAVPVILLTAITLAILSDQARAKLLDWLPTYRAAGGKVAFDSNWRPKLWATHEAGRAAIEALWRQTDIALPSVDDEMAIFGDADAGAVVSRLKGWGVSDGALKCGPGGPISLGEEVDQSYAKAQVVRDTTAAGDSFNGGYLAARLSGAFQAEALKAGHDLALEVLAHPGAIIPKG